MLLFRAFFEKSVFLENGQLWNQSIFLNETFKRGSSWRFTKNGSIVDGCGPCLMSVTPIFWKPCFFKKGPEINNFWKIKIFFCISGSNFIGLFNGISFVFILLVVFGVQRNLCLAKRGVVYLSLRDCRLQRGSSKIDQTQYKKGSILINTINHV